MTRTTISIQLVVNLVFGILVLLAVRRYMKYANITIDIGAWGVFYTVFGVLYAIIIGFILISALGKFDQLKLAVDSEVSEIQSIRILLQYFSDNLGLCCSAYPLSGSIVGLMACPQSL